MFKDLPGRLIRPMKIKPVAWKKKAAIVIDQAVYGGKGDQKCLFATIGFIFVELCN
jgi:hypothetical protein